MGFVEGSDRGQRMLFPESVDDYITGDNPVRFIEAFVESQDLIKLGFTHAIPEETGRPPYDPRDLCKLYIYGYLNKIRSSRQLEHATYRNIELLWLLRKLHPDFKTIADFRKDNADGLKKLCRQFTLLCKKMDLFGGELIAIDGSKFSASNHNSRTYTTEKLRQMFTSIDEKIAAYFALLAGEDEAEEKVIPSARAKELNDQIAKLEEHKRELERLEQMLLETGQSQISQTDPDSRMMRTGTQGVDASYNVQIAVDSKHKLIVDHDTTSDTNDQNQLSRMAIRAKETLGVQTLEVTADAGYYNKAEIKRCEDEQITCYVPEPEKSQNKLLGLYTDKDFRYDPTRDCYICPASQELTYRFQSTKGGKETRVYEGIVCKGCTLRSQCTRSQHGNRRVYRWVDEQVIETMHRRMLEQPEKVKKRKELVEHPFGTIKRSMNQGYFLMRGRAKVSAEVSLSVLAYNIKRVLNIIGLPKLVEAIKTLVGGAVRSVCHFFCSIDPRAEQIF
jgi:transposase